MIRYGINRTKAFIPLKISQGTTEQRFQKARLFNLKFYDELQDCIKDKEIAPRTFVQKLRKVTGAKLGLDIYEVESAKNSSTRYVLDGQAKNIGYAIGIPLTFYTKKIHKNNARTFLTETQNVLNEAFNPKILQRFIALANRGINITKLMEFYSQTLATPGKLNEEALNEFLKGKSNIEKINSLQFMRYKLLSQINSQNALYQIDRSIEKHNGLKFIHQNAEYYNLDKYDYENKLKVLEEKIKESIAEQRA